MSRGETTHPAQDFGRDTTEHPHVERYGLVRAICALGTIALFTSCASDLGSVSPLSSFGSPNNRRLGKTIGVATASTVAATGVEKASGRIGAPGEGAVNGMRTLVTSLGADEASTIVEVALLPVAAVVGAVAEFNKTVSPGDLATAEIHIRAGLHRAAAHSAFLDAFLSVARERSSLNFLPVRDWDDSTRGSNLNARALTGFDSVLELSLTDLRLRRTSLSDARCYLCVNGRVRLLSATDGTILYDSPIEFQSASSLYFEWTHDNGAPIVRAADHAFKSMAEEVVARLFVRR